MFVRSLRLAALFVLAASGPAFAQTPGKVDYKRDVQPLLQEHCYECHGAEQQASGFRLDRRSDALRGGVQSDMAPGNAEGTRLYQKLIGTKVGQRMPAGRPPLPPEKIAILKAWIDQGIDWPDEFSGEKPVLPADPTAARMVEALRTGDHQAVQRAVRKNPAIVNRIAGRGGASLLMFGAMYADVPTLTLMLNLGGDPNLTNQVGATALMWASDNVDRTRLLLAKGAGPNARSETGTTPLMAASARNQNGQVIKLLLEHGATPPTGRALTQLLAKCPECAAVLSSTTPQGVPPVSNPAAPRPPAAAASPAPPTVASPAPSVSGSEAMPPTKASIRAAVQRSLPPLEKHDMVFMERTGCVSCHNNSLTTMAQDAARRNGYAIDEAGMKRSLMREAAYLEGWRETALQVMNIGGGQDVISYILAGMHAGGYAGDIATDAMVRFLLGVQEPDGRFLKAPVPRAPHEGSLFTTTALSVRGIRAFAPKAWREQAMTAVQRATTWLATADAKDTEDRTFQVLGLHWAGHTGPALTRAAQALLAEQRPDGGWGQLPSMQTDAYATGQALVALRESGQVAADDPAFLRGVQYLLRTQAADGSWFVKTRTKFRIQAQFDLGFPSYGEDTWISAAATNFATTALALAGRGK